jgi:hypothetical protein
VGTTPKASDGFSGGAQEIFDEVSEDFLGGNGKADGAKLPGVGILPKPCPRKRGRKKGGRIEPIEASWTVQAVPSAIAGGGRRDSAEFYRAVYGRLLMHARDRVTKIGRKASVDQKYQWGRARICADLRREIVPRQFRTKFRL